MDAEGVSLDLSSFPNRGIQPDIPHPLNEDLPEELAAAEANAEEANK